MSTDTLVKKKCGCTVRGGFHTWEYRVYTVEVIGNGGGLVDTVDVRADGPECAVGAVRAELSKRGVKWERYNWFFQPIGYSTARASCCPARNPCDACQKRAF
ncbi:hypothetical protein ACFY2K_11710 [Kitasatospora sp. NPDC001309]|uniref:hypothetical protein n=1 Tax=Kitasatospora sp. NPDC001309 TaxID=3364013 RepID=UPI0036CB9206